jgi:surface protein
MSGFAKKTLTDDNIQEAVNMWIVEADDDESEPEPRRTAKEWRAEAERIYGHISEWDVSRVTNMSSLFSESRIFNDDISGWNVSNVTSMSNMFWDNKVFNQPIGDWDVSNVTDMQGMFWDAKSFNQPIGDWDVSNVTNMSSMFRDAKSFNQPIGNWDVSNVVDMEDMFRNAISFNQHIGNWTLLNNGESVNMRRMFWYCGNWEAGNNITQLRNNVAPAFTIDGDGNVVNGEHAEGVGVGVAFEIHNAFAKINTTSYIKTINNYLNDLNEETPFFKGGELLPITTDEEKQTVITEIIKVSKIVFDKHIKDFEEGKQTSTQRTFGWVTNKFKDSAVDDKYIEIILVTFAYVWSSQWDDDERGEYIYTWISENAEAYNSNPDAAANISCVEGIIERVVLSLTTILSKDDLNETQHKILNIINNVLPDMGEIFQLWVNNINNDEPTKEIITKAKTGSSEITEDDKKTLQDSFTKFAKEIYEEHEKSETDLTNDTKFTDYKNGIDEYIGYMEGGWRHRQLKKMKRKTIKKRKTHKKKQTKKRKSKKSSKKKKKRITRKRT